MQGRQLRTRKRSRRPSASDRQRSTSSQRGYDARWRKSSSAFLLAPVNALCRECRKRGKLTAATCVDHIIPHKGDRHLFWDKTNWQPLCHQCHSIKTVKEDGGFGRQIKHGTHSQTQDAHTSPATGTGDADFGDPGRGPASAGRA